MAFSSPTSTIIQPRTHVLGSIGVLQKRLQLKVRSFEAMSGLLDLKKLDIESKLAVAWDTRKGLGAVGEVSRDGQATLTTNAHTHNTDVPALDDLALANLE